MKVRKRYEIVNRHHIDGRTRGDRGDTSGNRVVLESGLVIQSHECPTEMGQHFLRSGSPASSEAASGMNRFLSGLSHALQDMTATQHGRLILVQQP